MLQHSVSGASGFSLVQRDDSFVLFLSHSNKVRYNSLLGILFFRYTNCRRMVPVEIDLYYACGHYPA